jgi:hypothetical protein
MTDDQSAADVFGLLSDETRVDVLRAIALAQSERDVAESGSGVTALSFSEVYERVDVDNTSKLSYHLGELVGTFLRKDDEHYSFTHAGEQIVRFILAENYEQPPDFGPQETAGTCLFCGASPLIAGVSEQYFTVTCPDCERPVFAHKVTPAEGRTHGDDALVGRVKRRMAADYAQVRQGACPECGGRVDSDVRELDAGMLPEGAELLAVDRCTECLRQYNSPLPYAVAYHPASVAFHWERGVDITNEAPWTFHDHLRTDRWTAERASTDPEEYEVVYREGDDELRFRLDADGAVAWTERVRASRGPRRRE